MASSNEMCFCCQKTLSEGETVKVKDGIHNLRRVSKIRNDGNFKMLKEVNTIQVHKICRREYIKEKNIARDEKKKRERLQETKQTMRSEEKFDFKNKCLFCSDICDTAIEKKKNVSRRRKIWEVRVLHLKTKISDFAKERKDELGDKVFKRVNSVLCLVAEEARYHEVCYSNFFTNTSSSLKRGRPKDEHIDCAFEKLCRYIEESEECQFTLHDLMKILEENMPESSSVTEKTLKNKLIDTYEDRLMFFQMKKRSTLVCFRGSGLKLTNTWYTEREKSEKDERLRIVKTAATIIREDIRTNPYNTTDYPDITEFMKNADDDVPETLHAFLELVVQKDKKSDKGKLEKKCTAIAHAIISATRPRSFLSCLLLGLAGYLFRKTGSRTIVNTVSNFGFCSAYNDVSLLESSAAISWKPDVEGDSFCQYVFDNADFNIQTLSGKGTFHSMGGIKCITPSRTVRTQEINKLRSIPSSNEIAAAGNIKIRKFEGKQKQGLNALELKNVCNREDVHYVSTPAPKDVLWMYGKFLQTPSFPSWQGFMEGITYAHSYEQSKILALPFISLPPTEYNTVLSALNYAAEETKKSKQVICFVTFDQPLYIKAKDIVSSNPNGELSNIIVRLGGFHLLMSYLGSIGYIMDGSGISELWSTVYGSSSVPHMLSGHAYARAIRAHMLTYCALAKLILQELTIDDSDRQHVEQLLSSFKTHPPSFTVAESDNILKRIQVNLNDHMANILQKGKTAQLWLQYFDLVTVALHFIEAERMGNWKLHLDCVRTMLPIFYATGHIQYAKSCQLYLQDMDSLHLKMPHSEYQKFTADGYFTIRRSEKYWSGVWSDMTIEQTLMKNMKSIGGITHGRGFTESVLKKWVLGLPVAHHLCESVERFSGVQTCSSYQHIELRESRIGKDEENVQTFVEWLHQHSPFIVTEGLVSLSTGMVAPEHINCYKAKDIGKKMMEESLKNKDTFGELKVQRNKRVKPMSSTIASVRVDDDIIHVDSTQLFQRIICTVKVPQELEDSFSYELATVPLSIFDEAGLMRKTRKSAFYKMFNDIKEGLIHDSGTKYVIDGGHLIHRVVWPKQGSFADVSATYVNFIKKHYGKEVTVIFDGYSTNEISTKSNLRQRRQMKQISPEIIFNDNTSLTVPQVKFLSNLKNKQRLIMHLCEAFHKQGIETHTAVDDADVLIIQTAISEADQHESVVVVGQDVDLLTLITALTPEDKNVLMLKEAQGNIPRKVYSSQEIQQSNVLRNIKESVMFAHSFSGCDTTSSFYGQGKMKAVSLLNKYDHFQDIVAVFNNPLSTHDEVAAAGEKFILALYNAPSTERDLNHYRYISFNKNVSQSSHAVMLSSLPPTSAAGRQHSYRVYYQIQTWRGEVKQPDIWGWKKRGDGLSPVYTTAPPAPAKILKVIACSCKSGCGRRCGCVRAGLSCSAMCSMCNGQACLNSPQVMHSTDDLDSDNEDLFQ